MTTRTEPASAASRGRPCLPGKSSRAAWVQRPLRGLSWGRRPGRANAVIGRVAAAPAGSWPLTWSRVTTERHLCPVRGEPAASLAARALSLGWGQAPGFIPAPSDRHTPRHGASPRSQASHRARAARRWAGRLRPPGAAGHVGVLGVPSSPGGPGRGQREAASFAVAPRCLQGSGDAGVAGPAPGNPPCPGATGASGAAPSAEGDRPGPEPRRRPGRASRASASQQVPPRGSRLPGTVAIRRARPPPSATRGSAARPEAPPRRVGVPRAVCLALASARREWGAPGSVPGDWRSGRGRPCGPGGGVSRALSTPRRPRAPRAPRPPPLGTSRSPQPLSQARKSGVFSHLTRVSINSVPAPANPRHRRQKEAN